MPRMHKNEAQTRPQHHPEDYPRDLNPDQLAGQNYGVTGPHPEKATRTADDIKGLHGRLSMLTSAELKEIPVLPEGSRLEQGATYLDLLHLERGPFTAAEGEMRAGPDNYYVPKSAVDYTLWNRLTGVTDPARLDEATNTAP